MLARIAASAATRIGRLRDRPADHQIVGARADRRFRRDDPRLVVALRAGEPNAGRHELEVAVRTPRAAPRLRAPSRRRRRDRCDCASFASRSTCRSRRSAARRSRQGRRPTGSSAPSPRSAAARAAPPPSRPRSHRLARGRQHRRAAGRMHVQHPDAEARRRGAGLRHGVRDVVELEIEEHAKAALDACAHDVRPGRRRRAPCRP